METKNINKKFYERWKLFILPIRNGNAERKEQIEKEVELFILPIRNGNQSANTTSKLPTAFLSYL